MSVYYHISLGEEIVIRNELNNNNSLNIFRKSRSLHFTKKNSYWYNIWKDIGENVIKSYTIYKLTIPSCLFTDNFNPNKKKLVRINGKNVEDYKKLRDKKLIKNYAYMRNNNVIGIDMNTHYVYNNAEQTNNSNGSLITYEGWLFELHNDIKCEKVGIYSNGKYTKL